MPEIKGQISEEKAKEVIIELWRKVGLLRGMLFSMIAEVTDLADHHPDVGRQEDIYTMTLPDAEDVMEITKCDLDELVGCEVDWDEEMGSRSAEDRLALTQDAGGSNPSSPATTEESIEEAKKILREIHFSKDEEDA